MVILQPALRKVAAGLAVSLLAAHANAMELESTNVRDGAALSIEQVKSECGGANISPALSWTGAPPTAKSFAVTMYDPDAHGGWWHWAVFDIPGNVNSLPRGAGSGEGLPPSAKEGKNDFGDNGYGGACPPPGSGLHHYEITVWAMPVASLPLDASTKAETTAAYLEQYAIARATITPVYQR